MPRWAARRPGGFTTARAAMSADCTADAAAGTAATTSAAATMLFEAVAPQTAEARILGDHLAFPAGAGSLAEAVMAADLTFRAATFLDTGVPYDVPWFVGGVAPEEGFATATAVMSATGIAEAAAGTDAVAVMSPTMFGDTTPAEVGVPYAVPFTI